MKFIYHFLKRCFDFTVALLMLFMSVPFWLLAGFSIFLEDGFPIFFAKRCFGKKMKEFKLYKFRSMFKEFMHDEAGGIDWTPTKSEDERITKVGKALRLTALDELPQLISIIKGDLALVGPRAISIPLARNCAEGLPDFYKRYQVKPGLTGLAQIYLLHEGEWPDKLRYDLEYIERAGFLFDLSIIFKSFYISFTGRWERNN